MIKYMFWSIAVSFVVTLFNINVAYAQMNMFGSGVYPGVQQCAGSGVRMSREAKEINKDIRDEQKEFQRNFKKECKSYESKFSKAERKKEKLDEIIDDSFAQGPWLEKFLETLNSQKTCIDPKQYAKIEIYMKYVEESFSTASYKMSGVDPVSFANLDNPYRNISSITNFTLSPVVFSEGRLPASSGASGSKIAEEYDALLQERLDVRKKITENRTSIKLAQDSLALFKQKYPTTNDKYAREPLDKAQAEQSRLVAQVNEISAKIESIKPKLNSTPGSAQQLAKTGGPAKQQPADKLTSGRIKEKDGQAAEEKPAADPAPVLLVDPVAKPAAPQVATQTPAKPAPQVVSTPSTQRPAAQTETPAAIASPYIQEEALPIEGEMVVEDTLITARAEVTRSAVASASPTTCNGSSASCNSKDLQEMCKFVVKGDAPTTKVDCSDTVFTDIEIQAIIAKIRLYNSKYVALKHCKIGSNGNLEKAACSDSSITASSDKNKRSQARAKKKCEDAVGSAADVYAEYIEAESRNETCEEMIEDFETTVEDLYADLDEEMQTATEGSFCYSCYMKNGRVTMAGEEPGIGERILSALVPAALTYGGYRLHKNAISSARDLGYTVNNSPSFLSYGWPLMVGGVYGALTGNTGHDASIACASSASGAFPGLSMQNPYAMMSPYGQGAFANPYAYNPYAAIPGLNGIMMPIGSNYGMPIANMAGSVIGQPYGVPYSTPVGGVMMPFTNNMMPTSFGVPIANMAGSVIGQPYGLPYSMPIGSNIGAIGAPIGGYGVPIANMAGSVIGQPYGLPYSMPIGSNIGAIGAPIGGYGVPIANMAGSVIGQPYSMPYASVPYSPSMGSPFIPGQMNQGNLQLQQQMMQLQMQQAQAYMQAQQQQMQRTAAAYQAVSGLQMQSAQIDMQIQNILMSLQYGGSGGFNSYNPGGNYNPGGTTVPRTSPPNSSNPR